MWWAARRSRMMRWRSWKTMFERSCAAGSEGKWTGGRCLLATLSLMRCRCSRAFRLPSRLRRKAGLCCAGIMLRLLRFRELWCRERRLRRRCRLPRAGAVRRSVSWRAKGGLETFGGYNCWRPDAATVVDARFDVLFPSYGGRFSALLEQPSGGEAGVALTQAIGFDIFRRSYIFARHSSVAQWQSIRLLTEGL